jgi:translation elongation factor EF-Tu-like GTPase
MGGLIELAQICGALLAIVALVAVPWRLVSRVVRVENRTANVEEKIVRIFDGVAEGETKMSKRMDRIETTCKTECKERDQCLLVVKQDVRDLKGKTMVLQGGVEKTMAKTATLQESYHEVKEVLVKIESELKSNGNDVLRALQALSQDVRETKRPAP